MMGLLGSLSLRLLILAPEKVRRTPLFSLNSSSSREFLSSSRLLLLLRQIDESHRPIQLPRRLGAEELLSMPLETPPPPLSSLQLLFFFVLLLLLLRLKRSGKGLNRDGIPRNKKIHAQ